jgi:hypothetical protein
VRKLPEFENRGRYSKEDFNSLIHEVERLGRMSVESPLELVSGPNGLMFRFVSPCFWAEITGGDASGYDWSEVQTTGSCTFTTVTGGRSGTASLNPAFEVNGHTVGAGEIVWLTPGYNGEFLFEQDGNAGTVTSITEGTGIVCTPNPIVGSGTVALADTAVTPGSYGDSTHVATFTVDQQGRLTAASSVAITAGSGTVTDISEADGSVVCTPNPITGSGTVGLSTTGVTAGSYGDATHVGAFTVDAQGRLTAASSVGISVGVTEGGTGVTSCTTGDILYASATNVFSTLGIGTDGYVLTVSGGLPSWQPTLPDPVTVTHGGTGLTSCTTGDLFYGSGVNTVSALGIGTDGYVLTVVSGLPSWQPAGSGSGTVTSISQGTGIVCTPNPITGVGTVALDGTYLVNNQVLYGNGGAIVSDPVWTYSGGQITLGDTSGTAVTLFLQRQSNAGCAILDFYRTDDLGGDTQAGDALGTISFSGTPSTGGPVAIVQAQNVNGGTSPTCQLTVEVSENGLLNGPKYYFLGQYSLGVGTNDFGGGSGGIAIKDRTSAPSLGPSGGGFLYSDSGKLHWYDSTGTDHQIAPFADTPIGVGTFGVLRGSSTDVTLEYDNSGTPDTTLSVKSGQIVADNTGNTAVYAIVRSAITYGGQDGTDYLGNVFMGGICTTVSTTLPGHGGRSNDTSSQSISDSTTTVPSFTVSTDFDTDTYVSVSNLQIPTGLGGLYYLTAATRFAASASGTQRRLRLLVNGSAVSMVNVTPLGGGNTTALNCSTCYKLSAGDSVSMDVFQDSGGSLDIDLAAVGCLYTGHA